MIWTGTYKPSAEQELARLWNGAPDRGAVTAAANQIDALLKTDPLTCGESRSEATRILLVPPLAVLFETSEDDCIVEVLQVWRIPPPN
jgi:hypothetical protein